MAHKIFAEGALKRFLEARALGNVPPAKMKKLRAAAAKEGRPGAGATVLHLVQPPPPREGE